MDKGIQLISYETFVVNCRYITNFPQIFANFPFIFESLNFAGHSALWMDCKTKNLASGFLHFCPGMKMPHLQEPVVLLSTSIAWVETINWRSKALITKLTFFMLLNHSGILSLLAGCLIFQTFILLIIKYKENQISTSQWTTTTDFPWYIVIVNSNTDKEHFKV